MKYRNLFSLLVAVSLILPAKAQTIWFSPRFGVDLEQWFDAYQAATGQPLAFFRVDMQWSGEWQSQMQQLGRLLHSKGIPLQIIYNGAGNAGSDEAWIAQAIGHFEQYQTNGSPRPDVVVFQCWTPNPTHVLPESDPRTMTGLIKQYLQWKQAHP